MLQRVACVKDSVNWILIIKHCPIWNGLPIELQHHVLSYLSETKAEKLFKLFAILGGYSWSHEQIDIFRNVLYAENNDIVFTQRNQHFIIHVIIVLTSCGYDVLFGATCLRLQHQMVKRYSSIVKDVFLHLGDGSFTCIPLYGEETTPTRINSYDYIFIWKGSIKAIPSRFIINKLCLHN